MTKLPPLAKLPPLSAELSPAFVDAASCRAWLELLPLANVVVSQQQLLHELEKYNRFPSSAARRLAVMEALREAVNFVQIEQAKRFTGRALPLTEVEAATFNTTVALWEQMRLGYLRCLDAALGGDGALRASAAQIAQRLLAYCGLKMYHHYRAYRQVPNTDWRALHEAYESAEKLGVADEPVRDVLNRDLHESSPRVAYARAVLMGLCNPYDIAPRQLSFVAHLLERWAGKLEISATPVSEAAGLPPLVADLGGDRCPGRADPKETHYWEARYLDTRKIARSLKNRIALLQKGESPAALGLGEDCVQPYCEQLLVYLFRQWCQPRPARAAERARAAPTAQVCNDLQAIHYYIAGRPFQAPDAERPLTAAEREQIETFGHLRSRAAEDEDYSQARGFLVEQWRIEEDSAQGLRVMRSSGSAGKRYAHGQLVAVRPADTRSFILGQVRWLMASDSGDLYAGLKLLPGLPAAIAVRALGAGEKDTNYVPALGLGSVQALNVPASLVLPPGWFKPGRQVEVYTDSGAPVRLTALLERGVDFERVAFEKL